jgi:hypothetical protein
MPWAHIGPVGAAFEIRRSPVMSPAISDRAVSLAGDGRVRIRRVDEDGVVVADAGAYRVRIISGGGGRGDRAGRTVTTGLG